MRVVVDGKVIESDGKTENTQHVLALDSFTLAVLKACSTRSGETSGRTTTTTVCCSVGRTADRRIPAIRPDGTDTPT